MKIFDEKGHITDEAINAMVEYELSDRETFEFCAHIAECDMCSARYTDALECGELLEPAEDFAEDILKSAAEKKKPEKKNGGAKTIQILKFAVAAALTFVIWGRAIDLDAVVQNQPKPQEEENRAGISRMFSDFTYTVQDGLTKSMSSASDFLKVWQYQQPQEYKADEGGQRQ